MGKKILAVYYSQSGQTKAILDNFLRPVIADGNEVEYLQVKTMHTFPFPWPIPDFFDTVPESVEVIPAPLQPWHTNAGRYDLMVLGWQPWNLSPSIPVNSILQDEKFKEIIKGTPVITICGCRNMWINAQEKNKKLLNSAGAKLVGNIALADRHWNHISYFTILHWVSTGRKDRKWGIFPKPGVSDKDIKNAAGFGNIVVPYLYQNDYRGMQNELAGKGAVQVKYSLMYIERKAAIIFQKWVTLIRKFPGKRSQILKIYRYYITIALLVASPLILLVNSLFLRLLQQKKIRRLKQYYRGIDYKKDI